MHSQTKQRLAKTLENSPKMFQDLIRLTERDTGKANDTASARARLALQPPGARVEIEASRPGSSRAKRGASLNRAVKETPGVKGENGEFEWLRNGDATDARLRK